MAATHEIPSNQDYDGSGRKPWRIAEGKLKRGRQEDGNLEERDYIVGLLHNVFIKEGHSDTTGEPYQYVAALLENQEDGKFVVHASTSSKVSSGTFASSLLLTKGGEIISITPNLSAKPTKYGNYVTYTNLKEKTDKGWVELRNDEFLQVDEAVERMRDLPHYKEPEEDGVEPFDQLAAYAKKRGWPGPESHDDYSAAWLKVANRVFTAAKVPEVDEWSDLMEGHIATLIEKLDSLKECPKAVLNVNPFEDAPAAKPAEDPLADL